MAFIVGTSMDRAAVLLNDPARTDFTYAAMLPFFKIAYDELKEFLQESNVPITNAVTSPVITLPTNTIAIGFTTTPPLPADFIEPKSVYERTAGSSEEFAETKRQDFLEQRTTQGTSLEVWTWQNQEIRFIGAIAPREVKLEYIADTLGTITDENTPVSLINALNYLSFRTAGLCARFIGENTTRADQLDGFASGALDRVLNITIKSRQTMTTRRRPFMASHRMRS